jgi:poly(3-hydroxybutyrate) depolymerase
VDHQLLARAVPAAGLTTEAAREYYLCVPHKGAGGAPVFVSVHGVSRNAEDHARYFAPLTERYGVVLIAPCFPAARYPDYQRLSRANRGPRADHALDRMIAEVGQLTGANTDKFYLFGYSGGGQFAHRYTLAHPERVARLAIGAAGWYTMPDPNLPYPAGIRSSPALPEVTFDAARFLAVPTCILVGERDNKRGERLRKGARLDGREGATRIERGLRWAEAMRDAARGLGLEAQFEYRILPGVGHSFSRGMRRAGLGTAVFDFLFGAVPS